MSFESNCLNLLMRQPRVPLKATVLTAADSGYFKPLQCLAASLRVSHDCQIAVVDLGLRSEEREWCRRHGLALKMSGELAMPKTRYFWQTWNKPAFVGRMKKPTIWLDADCVVTGSLRFIDRLLAERPVMFTDTAATHFCGWEAGTDNVTNEEPLYVKYPTPVRFAAGDWPNAGVLAFDPRRELDRKLLDTWRLMVQRAANEPALALPESANHDQQGHLRWYDQGALQWALEKLDLRELVLADQRFNDPVSAAGAKTSQELLDKLAGLRQTAVAHFPSGIKPYHLLPETLDFELAEYPANRRDLTLLVLGHKKDALRRVKGPCLRTVYLPHITADNDLAESRLFVSNILRGCDSEYLGLCTNRWDEKYRERCLPLAELHKLPQQRSRVWAGYLAAPDWLDYSETVHPGISYFVRFVAERLRIHELERPSVWSNNFIAHASVARGLQDWVWHALGMVYAEFGPRPEYGMEGMDRTRYGSYLAERLSMLYFCMRSDLKLVQIPQRLR